MENPILFFIHIPKTAGLTMQQILAAEYPRGTLLSLHDVPDEQRMDAVGNVASEVRAVAGHIDARAVRMLPRPARIFTMLRDPVERLISLYHFFEREPNVAGHADVASGRLTLPKLARKQGDHQARYIAGYGPKDEVEPDRLVAEAKRNLSEEFAAFGLAGRFDESLILFQRTFGWKRRDYSRRNVTRNRPAAASHPPEQLAEVRRWSRVDAEVHAFACELFDRRIAAQPADFFRELRSLRQRHFVRHQIERFREVAASLSRRIRLPR